MLDGAGIPLAAGFRVHRAGRLHSHSARPHGGGVADENLEGSQRCPAWKTPATIRLTKQFVHGPRATITMSIVARRADSLTLGTRRWVPPACCVVGWAGASRRMTLA
jgi:hypothetical protein